MREQVERRATWLSSPVENARARIDCLSCGAKSVTVAVADAVFIRLKTMGPIEMEGHCDFCRGPARVTVELRPAAEL